MNDELSRMAANAIAHEANICQRAVVSAVAVYEAPSVVHRPRLFPDGNMWCALLGDNLQEGLAGFGETPAKAMWAFDLAFFNERTPTAIIGAKAMTENTDLQAAKDAASKAYKAALAAQDKGQTND